MTDDVRIGIDIGGTFTDIVVLSQGIISVTKIPSDPDSPDRSVEDAIKTAADTASFIPEQISSFAHGTTITTNVVLEESWSEVALITTEGFRDILEIGRQDRPDIYDIHGEKPSPIVPRNHRFEVQERIDERGTVVTPIDQEQVKSITRTIGETAIDSVGISFLFSFENDTHERQVKSVLSNQLEIPVSVSSEVLPELGEYERTVATALDAALKPLIDEYLHNVDKRIQELQIPVDLAIMQSNGGIVNRSAARTQPLNTVLSGPAAGVQGATWIAELTGLDDVITMDMGGTSCDVSLVRDGDPIISTDVTVGEYPIPLPMIDIHTIGAGGGSIAWVDSGGALRVGPASAGSSPGPICYARGGTHPTITDAHYILGRLGQGITDRFGTNDADVRAGLQEQIADPLDIDVKAAAQGILDVANANMERAVRVVSVERGYDPRECSLVAFGGAGPLHAGTLARQLDIPRVVVPRTAGVLSALGLLVSDAKYDYSVSRVRKFADVDLSMVREKLREFEQQGNTQLETEGIDPAHRVFEPALDLRYVGQSFTLRVPVPFDIGSGDRDAISTRFHECHETRYGYASPTEPLELVTIRLRVRGSTEPPDLRIESDHGTLDEALITRRTVTFAGEDIQTNVYHRTDVPVATEIDGPAVIEGTESTAIVWPNQSAHRDEYGNLVVDLP